MTCSFSTVTTDPYFSDASLESFFTEVVSGYYSDTWADPSFSGASIGFYYSDSITVYCFSDEPTGFYFSEETSNSCFSDVNKGYSFSIALAFEVGFESLTSPFSETIFSAFSSMLFPSSWDIDPISN